MKKLSIVFLVIVVIVGVYVLIDNYQQDLAPLRIHPATNANVGDVVEFRGVLTKFDDKCKVDISCIAYVDGFRITINPGDVSDPLPLGESDVWNEDVGKLVSVRAKKIGFKELTIEGSEEYFLLKEAE